MSAPPNEFISQPMWNLAERRPNPDWVLSGIYANKRAYHNTVKANRAKWPNNNYSIRVPLDLVPYNLNFARAIDLSMSKTEMIRWTTQMMVSALNPVDNRLKAVREFYGTLNGETVYGLIKDDEDGPWRRTTADDSHLSHGHTSIFTAFVNSWSDLKPILSVWAGQSFSDWSSNMFPVKGDASEEVSYWQRKHNQVRILFPSLPLITVDGDYGDETCKAFLAWYKMCGGQSTTFKGEFMTSFMGIKYDIAFVNSLIPVVGK